jgi:hypothetical protein
MGNIALFAVVFFEFCVVTFVNFATPRRTPLMGGYCLSFARSCGSE